MLGFSSYIRSISVLWLLTILPIFSFLAVNERFIIARQFEYDSDRQALLVIGNLDVSMSVLMALILHSKNRKADDQELDEHPKISKRIKALRIAAQEAGIADNTTTTLI